MARVDFGDPLTFAVSVQLAPDYHGVWWFGNLCYWISNQMVGEFGVTTSLRDVLGQMQQLVKDSGRRQNPTLFCAPSEDVFYSLDAALYDGENVLTRNPPVQLPEDYAVFDGKIPVESFDGWKIFVVDCVDKTKLLFKKKNEPAVRTAVLDYGQFDNVILMLYDYINRMFEKESNLPDPPGRS